MEESFPVAMTIESLDGLHTAYRMAREKFKRPPWFRGHWDASWKLLPSVFRGRESEDPHHERFIANRFRTQAPLRHAKCPENEEHFAWLCLMRHYGLPTRLLDWSESILVAAYFAVNEADCEWESDEDTKTTSPGTLWALNAHRLDCVNPEERADRAGFPHTPDTRGVGTLAAHVFGVQPELQRDFGVLQATLAVIPNEVDLRMLMQNARFTIHGRNGAVPEPLEEQAHGQLYLMRFEIAKGFKGTLRNMLVELGINEHTLFPDLEHLARGIVEGTKVDEIVPQASDAEGPAQAG